MNTSKTIEQIVNLLLAPIPHLPQGSFIVKRKPQPGELAARRERRRAAVRTEPLRQPYLQEITLSGRLERGSTTAFAILGRDITILPTSWVFGELRVGVNASAQVIRDGEALKVRKLVVANSN